MNIRGMRPMFTQTAQGKFTANVSDMFHCGLDHSPQTFTFRVQIHWPDGALDEHGFLLDNLAFQQYFDGIGSFTESCEMLAKHCEQELAKMCGAKGEHISVDIGVPGLADIQYDATVMAV